MWGLWLWWFEGEAPVYAGGGVEGGSNFCAAMVDESRGAVVRTDALWGGLSRGTVSWRWGNRRVLGDEVARASFGLI